MKRKFVFILTTVVLSLSLLIPVNAKENKRYLSQYAGVGTSVCEGEEGQFIEVPGGVTIKEYSSYILTDKKPEAQKEGSLISLGYKAKVELYYNGTLLSKDLLTYSISQEEDSEGTSIGVLHLNSELCDFILNLEDDKIKNMISVYNENLDSYLGMPEGEERDKLINENKKIDKDFLHYINSDNNGYMIISLMDEEGLIWETKSPILQNSEEPRGVLEMVLVNEEESPVVKPEEKPVVKPEEKPVVKPEDKPVVKPEGKPELPVTGIGSSYIPFASLLIISTIVFSKFIKRKDHA